MSTDIHPVIVPNLATQANLALLCCGFRDSLRKGSKSFFSAKYLKPPFLCPYSVFPPGLFITLLRFLQEMCHFEGFCHNSCVYQVVNFHLKGTISVEMHHCFPSCSCVMFLWGPESSSLSLFTAERHAVISGAMSPGLSRSEIMKSSVFCLFVHGVAHQSHLSQGKVNIVASAHTCCFRWVQFSACCLEESSVGGFTALDH